MVKTMVGYGILIIYAIITLVCAGIGNYLDKKNGFSNGYYVGTIISLSLWILVGRKAAQA